MQVIDDLRLGRDVHAWEWPGHIDGRLREINSALITGQRLTRSGMVLKTDHAIGHAEWDHTGQINAEFLPVRLLNGEVAIDLEPADRLWVAGGIISVKRDGALALA